MAAEQFFNLNRDFVFYFEGWRTSWFPSFSIAPHEKTTCENPVKLRKRHPCIQFFLNISHRLRSEWLFILSLARLADIFARHLRMSILGRFLVVFSSITVLKGGQYLTGIRESTGLIFELQYFPKSKNNLRPRITVSYF